MSRGHLALALVMTFSTLVVGACKKRRGDFGPRFYTEPGVRVLCSKGIDRGHEWKRDTLRASLEVAREDRVVLQTFGHAPSKANTGVDLDELAGELDWAAASGIPTVTFRELADGYTGPGWALTIDDNEVDLWYGWRDFLRKHEVKVTFFVTKYGDFTAAQKRELKELAADGHDIESHGKAHLDAKITVAARGFDAYYRDEVEPGVAALVADGYAPVAFSYPYGEHTKEIDAAMLPHFKLIRATGGQSCLK